MPQNEDEHKEQTESTESKQTEQDQVEPADESGKSDPGSHEDHEERSEGSNTSSVAATEERNDGDSEIVNDQITFSVFNSAGELDSVWPDQATAAKLARDLAGSWKENAPGTAPVAPQADAAVIPQAVKTNGPKFSVFNSAGELDSTVNSELEAVRMARDIAGTWKQNV